MRRINKLQTPTYTSTMPKNSIVKMSTNDSTASRDKMLLILGGKMSKLYLNPFYFLCVSLIYASCSSAAFIQYNLSGTIDQSINSDITVGTQFTGILMYDDNPSPAFVEVDNVTYYTQSNWEITLATGQRYQSYDGVSIPIMSVIDANNNNQYINDSVEFHAEVSDRFTSIDLKMSDANGTTLSDVSVPGDLGVFDSGSLFLKEIVFNPVDRTDTFELQGSFNIVKALPLPGTLWFLISGMVSLFAYKRKSK